MEEQIPTNIVSAIYLLMIRAFHNMPFIEFFMIVIILGIILASIVVLSGKFSIQVIKAIREIIRYKSIKIGSFEIGAEKRIEENLDDSEVYRDYSRRVNEIRKGFMIYMYHYAGKQYFHDDETCNEHMIHLKYLFYKEIADFINTNHHNRKAVYSKESSKDDLKKMENNIATSWKNYKKGCEYIKDDYYKHYKKNIHLEIVKFYHEYQKQTIRMCENIITEINEHEFQTERLKKRMSRELEEVQKVLKDVQESLVPFPTTYSEKIEDLSNLKN